MVQDCPLCASKHLYMSKIFLEEAFERGAEECVDPAVIPAISNAIDEIHGYGNPHSHSHRHLMDGGSRSSDETRKVKIASPRHNQSGIHMARRGRSILASVGGSRKTLQNILLYTAAGIGGQIIKVAVERYQASNPTLPSFTQDIVLIGGGFALAFAPAATKGWSHEAKAAAAFLGLTMAVGRIFEYFRATVGFGVAPTFAIQGAGSPLAYGGVPSIASVPSVTGTA